MASSFVIMIKAFKFIFSGGLAALTCLSAFYILITFFHIWYLLASAISFLLSVAVGFYLQKYLTFENFPKENIKKQAVLFLIISLANLLINVILMLFFVNYLAIPKVLAEVFTLAILACWNFFVYQKFVFVNK